MQFWALQVSIIKYSCKDGGLMDYALLKEGTQHGSVVRSPYCQNIEKIAYCLKVSKEKALIPPSEPSTLE